MKRNKIVLTASIILTASLLSLILLRKKNKTDYDECGDMNQGKLTFDSGESQVLKSMWNDLDKLAEQMKTSPNCKVVVQGNGGTNRLLTQDRAHNITEYMYHIRQIDRRRFSVLYGSGANDNEMIYYPNRYRA